MLPTHIIHIIETYVLADFAFDDLALLDLAALVVTLRIRLPRNSVCVYASCAETEAKAASRMIEDFMVDWPRLLYAVDDEICCMRSAVPRGGFTMGWIMAVMNMLQPNFSQNWRHLWHWIGTPLMFSARTTLSCGSSYASV